MDTMLGKILKCLIQHIYNFSLAEWKWNIHTRTEHDGLKWGALHFNLMLKINVLKDKPFILSHYKMFCFGIHACSMKRIFNIAGNIDFLYCRQSLRAIPENLYENCNKTEGYCVYLPKLVQNHLQHDISQRVYLHNNPPKIQFRNHTTWNSDIAILNSDSIRNQNAQKQKHVLGALLSEITTLH